MSRNRGLVTGFGTVRVMGELLGYARVSTREQDTALQVDALQQAGCYKVFTDTVAGALDSRPELDRLREQLRPGDTVVVWRLDRMGRSIRSDGRSRGAGGGVPVVDREHRHHQPRWPADLPRVRCPGRV